MADFITSKVDGDTVAASEWNQLASIDNFITTSGQTPSTGDLNQMGVGSARYSSGGQFFTDSGTANAYVLSPVAPFQAPVSATVGYFNGMTIKFRAGNANSGASTVNVNSAGVKNLKKEDGTTDLAAGDISTTRDSVFRYNGTSFVLVIGANFATSSTSGTSVLPSPITIANNATDANNDIDFSAGVFQFSDGSGQAVATAMTKRLNANWTAGTNQGGLDTGAKANSTWYHCYAIYNPTTAVSDFLFSTGATTPTSLPSGYTKFKRVGSIRANSSGNIVAFYQVGNRIYFTNWIQDIGAGSTSTTSTTSTLTVPPIVGIIANVQLNFNTNNDTNIQALGIIQPTWGLDTPATGKYNIIGQDAGQEVVRTNAPCDLPVNASGQVRYVFNVTASNWCSFNVWTRGWLDQTL